MKEPKIPLAAAVLALLLGGPGFFYLGWRRGAKATLAWLLLASIIVSTEFREGATRIDPEAIYLFLLQAVLAWMAYRSCKRSNAEAAKAADSTDPGATETDEVTRRVDHNLQSMVESGCRKKMKDVSVFVIVGSGFALFAGLTHFNMPLMGEIGRFANAISPFVLCMGVWGLATESDCCERAVGLVSRCSSSAAFLRSTVPSRLWPFCSCLTETCPGGLFFYSRWGFCW